MQTRKLYCSFKLLGRYLQTGFVSVHSRSHSKQDWPELGRPFCFSSSSGGGSAPTLRTPCRFRSNAGIMRTPARPAVCLVFPRCGEAIRPRNGELLCGYTAAWSGPGASKNSTLPFETCAVSLSPDQGRALLCNPASRMALIRWTTNRQKLTIGGGRTTRARGLASTLLLCREN